MTRLKTAGVVALVLMFAFGASAVVITEYLDVGESSSEAIPTVDPDPNQYKSRMNNDTGQDDLTCTQNVHDSIWNYVIHQADIDDGDYDTQSGQPLYNENLSRKTISRSVEWRLTSSGFVTFLFEYPHQ
ncbi:hypothetical protein GF324_08505 [bacterium]|nr:hypothetical protein [bacterium]